MDSLESIIFDGATVRLEFVINRFDAPKPPAAPTGKKYTACRVAVSAPGFVIMVNKLNNIMAALIQQGIVHQASPPAGKPN